MTQQILAIIVIIFFVIKLLWQYKNKQIQKNEFSFWLIFWLSATAVILTLKQLDQLVASLGFSGSGIQIAFYLGSVILFYLIFRLRIRLAKMEKNISTLTEHIALNNVKSNEERDSKEKENNIVEGI